MRFYIRELRQKIWGFIEIRVIILGTEFINDMTREN